MSVVKVNVNDSLTVLPLQTLLVDGGLVNVNVSMSLTLDESQALTAFSTKMFRVEDAPLPSSASPQVVYDGGYDPSTAQGIRLRIANGAAGQTGLVKAWAHAFIRYMVEKGHEPFQVAWYLSESTESLSLLSKGEVDFALTYVPAAEAQLIRVGDASERVYAFRDQFVLVGPKCNPAGLKDDDDIFLMINKIVCHGHVDAANPPKDHPPTRFFSRSDRSATNIKESLLFLTIGQLPWALNNPSTWYHRHQCFPREALKIAASQSFYTLIDRGTWLDAAEDVTSALKAFRIGGEDTKYDPTDFLLNPAHLLCGSRLRPENESICKEFIKWVMADEGGQRVIDTFEKNGRVLYTRPPST